MTALHDDYGADPLGPTMEVLVPEIETIGGFRRYDPEGCELLLREVTFAEERFAELVIDPGEDESLDIVAGLHDVVVGHKLDAPAVLTLCETLLTWSLSDHARVPMDPAPGKTGSPKWRVRIALDELRAAIESLQMDEQ